jgi:chemotaxis protein CheC
MLTNLLADQPVAAPRLDASTREMLTEVGNILLNACLEMFGNLLHAPVSLSIPSLHLESLDAVLESLEVGKDEVSRALVVHTTFRLRNDEVTGYLIIVPDIASLDHLIKEAENWKERQ